MLAHRILQELRWGCMTSKRVLARNGHPGPHSFGFVQRLGDDAEICDRSRVGAPSTEKLQKRPTPLEDENDISEVEDE